MHFYYRGLPNGHPRFGEGSQGICRPIRSSGQLSPLQHNLGIPGSAFSQYTSWTSERAVAEMHAVTLSGRGLLLMLPTTPARPGDEWQWVGSPDHFGEKEVLLLGERFDCEVIIL